MLAYYTNTPFELMLRILGIGIPLVLGYVAYSTVKFRKLKQNPYIAALIAFLLFYLCIFASLYYLYTLNKKD